MGEFYRRCFYHSLDSDLKAGRSMSTVIDGKIVSVVKTRRMVAYARAQGWLSPETDCVSGRRLVLRAEIVRRTFILGGQDGVETGAQRCASEAKRAISVLRNLTIVDR
jgi:hypothetical protein